MKSGVSQEKKKTPSIVKKTEIIVESTPQSGPSLLDGNFDESESAQSFADALQSWRSGSQAKEVVMEKKKVVSSSASQANISLAKGKTTCK